MSILPFGGVGGSAPPRLSWASIAGKSPRYVERTSLDLARTFGQPLRGEFPAMDYMKCGRPPWAGKITTHGCCPLKMRLVSGGGGVSAKTVVGSVFVWVGVVLPKTSKLV